MKHSRLGSIAAGRPPGLDALFAPFRWRRSFLDSFFGFLLRPLPAKTKFETFPNAQLFLRLLYFRYSNGCSLIFRARAGGRLSIPNVDLNAAAASD
jgi:hypothetical protein